jgi:hypothetical protein
LFDVLQEFLDEKQKGWRLREKQHYRITFFSRAIAHKEQQTEITQVGIYQSLLHAISTLTSLYYTCNYLDHEDHGCRIATIKPTVS